jgi:hypothetical protein
MRRVAVVGCIVLLAFVASSNAGTVVVLGKKRLLADGVGWGTPHPRVIFNGGDPSGKAFDLHWSDWGSTAAHATGLTWVNRPKGGYYAKPAEIQLQAYRLGKCASSGPTAYTRLRAREATKPGGALSQWFAWGGWTTICKFP